MQVEASKPRSGGFWPRVVVYGALLVGLGVFLRTLHRDARGDLAALLTQVERARGGETYYREGRANLTFLPGRGWTLSMHVGADQSFSPARILVVQQLRARLQVELLVGIKHTIVLLNDEARAFLARTWLSLAPLEELFQAHFAAAPTQGPWAVAPSPVRVAAVGSGASLTPVGK